MSHKRIKKRPKNDLTPDDRLEIALCGDPDDPAEQADQIAFRHARDEGRLGRWLPEERRWSGLPAPTARPAPPQLPYESPEDYLLRTGGSERRMIQI
jgi:hypothetical protein